MSGSAASQPLFVLVLGHTRPWALRLVLEGLKREGALERTEVWLDGHSNHAWLRPKVLASRALQDDYPGCRFVSYTRAVGHARRMFDALEDVIQRHRRVLVLEDDCFPAPGSLAALDAALRAVEEDPGVFSVYGDPFALPGEGEGTYAFRPWGWATTREKLVPVLERMNELLRMPERAFLAWMRKAVEAHPPDRPFVAPGQAEPEIYLSRYQWDVVLPLLTSAQGIRNQVTAERVLFNFGIGHDSWHLVGSDARYFEPPFNMVTPADLARRFDLEIPELESRSQIAFVRTYRFVSGSDDGRLLDVGWGGPEAWGTWAVNPEARVVLRLPAFRKPKRLTLELLTRAAVHDSEVPVRVALDVAGRTQATWSYAESVGDVLQQVRLPARLAQGGDTLELVFRIEGAAAPAALGLSDDAREFGFGLSELRVTRG
ncbi:MAG: hypothetical protein QNJ98_11245 [Planctomycetota bacterium]|nr:hypothetical protein [Planctomycetota bacterium]